MHDDTQLEDHRLYQAHHRHRWHYSLKQFHLQDVSMIEDFCSEQSKGVLEPYLGVEQMLEHCWEHDGAHIDWEGDCTMITDGGGAHEDCKDELGFAFVKCVH